jgi:hypothetical protein
MKKVLLSLIAVLAISLVSQAQDYTHALGIRGGDFDNLGGGITYKSGPGGYELIASIGENRFQFMGLIENHYPLGPAGFHWYWGYGADLGVWSDNFTLGADGVIGLEYNLIASTSVPLNFTLDWIPRFQIINEFEFQSTNVNLGIRFTW